MRSNPRKRLSVFLAALLAGVAVFAQGPGEQPSVSWTVQAEPLSGETWQLTFSGRIQDGMHIYGLHPGIGNPVEVEYAADLSAGPLKEETAPVAFKGDSVFFRKAVFSQEVTAEAGTTVEGSIYWQACTDEMCGFPEEYDVGAELNTVGGQVAKADLVIAYVYDAALAVAVAVVETVLRTDLGGLSVKMDDLGDELGMSRVQLYRKVKALTGTSPVELLREMRLERAHKLITTTTKSIAEIAFEVGFNTPSYFSNCFKKQYGVYPSEMREG